MYSIMHLDSTDYSTHYEFTTGFVLTPSFFFVGL